MKNKYTNERNEYNELRERQELKISPALSAVLESLREVCTVLM